jgi:3-oxoacyl-[acyl-carrier-protein] synthase-1
MIKAFMHNTNIVSPLGFTTQENFLRVCEGKSGQKKYTSNGRSYFASVIEDTLLNDIFSSETKLNPGNFTRAEKMSLLSAQDVIRTSGVDTKNKRTLFIFSTTKGNINLLENKQANIPENRVCLHETAQIISSVFNFSNQPLVISNACISGLLAIILAKRLIQNNQYDHVVVTGVDVISDFILSGFNSLSALSGEACKPFDKNRKGINLGEAAATVLISNQKKTGGIEIISGASANDANHISGPSRTGEGLFKCLQKTLVENVVPDFINAHGTATEYNDEMESIALGRANLQNISVNSLKGYYGHTLGAAGVLESILCTESLRQEKLISSKGFEEQGTSVTLNVIKKTEHKKSLTCLKTASGFGGCNAAALFTL